MNDFDRLRDRCLEGLAHVGAGAGEADAKMMTRLNEELLALDRAEWVHVMLAAAGVAGVAAHA